jgi:hypothetical protein
MSMAHYQRDNKEIRLFGEKSVREEAYRKKILQLEKEISKLEILAKAQDEASEDIPINRPENLNNLYYESLMSFDARIKKEQDFLEKRASEITERLDTQSQKAIISMERLHRRQVRFLLLMMSGFAVFFSVIFFYPRMYSGRVLVNTIHADSMQAGIRHIRNALLEETIYRHNYKIGNIAAVDTTYAVNIVLNNMPVDLWYLRDIAQETVKAVSRFSGSHPAEITLSYGNKIYAKAFLSGRSSKPYIRYFQ